MTFKSLCRIFVSMLLFTIYSCESIDWRSAKRTNTKWTYEAFLQKYPQGSFADSARLGIEKLKFEETQRMNSIISYNKFLDLYPDGMYADTARSYIKELTKERHPAFVDTRTIRLIIKQSYNEAPDITLPFFELAQIISEYAGLEVVLADSDDFDVTLSISVKGYALGTEYNNGYHYSGVRISGRMSLKLSGKSYYNKPFSYLAGNPSYIERSYRTPASAPFEEPFADYFIPNYLVMMANFYGFDCVVRAALISHENLPHAFIYYDDFWKQDLSLPIQALKILREVKYNGAIGPLIAALGRQMGFYSEEKKRESLVQEKIIRILIETTGEDFGNDINKWKNWWENNKATYMSAK